MGTIEQVQQLATITNAPESFTLVVMILGALFTLIGGSYLFTWMGNRDIWKAINHLKDNDIHSIEKRLSILERQEGPLP